jgi:hypothetical protein
MQDDLAKYDDFWAAFFGLEAVQLRRPGVSIVKHAHLGQYTGVWFFVRGSSVVVSAPEAWLARLEHHRERIAAEPLPGSPLLRELFDRDPERVIGPVYQGHLPREAFRPVRDSSVRRLSSSDDPGLIALRAACTEEEWEHGGLGSASEPRFGYFLGGELVAAAGTDQWTADAVGPGVLSLPGQRGRGFGTAAVSAVVEHALAHGKLPLYQTLMAYAGSMAIATRLGYLQYATHVAVRVQHEPS